MIKFLIIMAIAIFIIIMFKMLNSKIESSRIQEKQSRFSSRESIPVEDIYLKFFNSMDLEKQSFIRNWIKAATLLSLDPTRLRPDDGFDKELAPVKGSMAADETEELDFMLLDYCVKNGIKRKDIKTPETFGEFITIITEKKS